MSDRRLAKHLVSLYLEDRPDTAGHDIIVCPHISHQERADEIASRALNSLHHLCPSQNPPSLDGTSIKRINISIRRNA